MYNILIKTIGKIGDILSTLYGWVAAAVIFLINLLCEYVSGFESIIYIVVFATMVDAFWGVARAVHLKEQTTSAMMRGTAAKLAVYGSLILVFVGLDRVIHSEDGITTIAASSIIILVEAWSILANAVICFPDMPFANLLKRFIAGEIAAKLGCDSSDIEEELGKINNK